MWPFRQGKPLGPSGERIAAGFLKRRRLKILATNYRCPPGEIDLIALEGATRENPLETIVFVEVKTRSSDLYTEPSSAVDSEKRRRVRKAARYYLATRPTEDYNVRFDIVSIVMRPGEKPQVEHIVDAFR